MSLTEYLAKNYLTADSAPTKKSKKRKRHAPEAAGLSIAEDDVSGWNDSNANGADDRDDDFPVPTASTGFRKSKTSKWKTVGSTAPSNAEQQAADEIIASAAAENNARAEADEDAPQIVAAEGDDGDDDDDGLPRMASGAKAGLQTGAQVTAALRKRQAEEMKRLQSAVGEANSKHSETIYRDATGRIVNAQLARAEALREKEDNERKEREKVEAVKGDVQKKEAEARRARLEDAKLLDVARYADDVELNDELKTRERWNDPAAAFLTKKEEGRSVTGKKLYKGSSEPNRYGIRPGHRWDGVDRSTGFEREWFAARNRQKSRRDLEYAWQMDE